MFLGSLFASAKSLDTNVVSNLNYIQNKGQWNKEVLYKSAFRGGTVFLEKNAFTYLFYPKEGIDYFYHNHQDSNSMVQFHSIKMNFENVIENHEFIEEDKQVHYQNYFIGNDSKKWATKVSSFKSITYKNLYQGISLKTFSNYNDVRYDFVLAPFANPNLIKFTFSGQNELLLKNGNLILNTEFNQIIVEAPTAYQIVNGSIKLIQCEYVLNKNTVSFSFKENYDKSLPLIIDPTLVFSTFSGAISDNWGMTATYDKMGNAYTGGISFGPDYPLSVGAFQISYNSVVSNYCDMTFTKFDPTGSNILFSTFVGGAYKDSPQSIIVDSYDNLLVLGKTLSPDFPVTNNAFDQSWNGLSDLAVLKIKSDGTALLASTFFGGTGEDGDNFNTLSYNYSDDSRGGIILDDLNNVYVASCTRSGNFPTSVGCYQSNFLGSKSACVFKMNPNLDGIIFSTFLGGNNESAAYNLALDSKNRVYVTGGTNSYNFPTTIGTIHPTYNGAIDGFVTHLSESGNSILQSSYIGTVNYDQSYFVQTDKDDNVYLYGQTTGNYPVSPNVYSNPNSGQFIHCLDSTLSLTKFSTVVGTGSAGQVDIVPSAFLVDNCRNIYISGWRGRISPTLPVTADAFQSTTDGSDFYFLVLTRDAQSLLYATFFGGNQTWEHVDGGTSRFDKSGVIYQSICGGCGAHSEMPTTPGAWSQTNNSWNCNNALVKFDFNMNIAVAQLSISSPTNSVCAPSQIDFTNQSINGVLYKWDFGDGTTSTTFQPSHTYNVPGNYTISLIAIDSSSCNIADTAYTQIIVMPNVSLEVIPEINTCLGDSINLMAFASGASTITWSPSTYLSNSSIVNPIVFPLTNITYTINATNGYCSQSDTLTINVNINNTEIILDEIMYCSNDTLPLFTNSVYETYSWSTGEVSSQINVNQNGTYYLSTIDSNGCIGFDSVLVEALAIEMDFISSISLCIGDSVRLDVIASNTDSISWSPSLYLDNFMISSPLCIPQTSTTYSVSAVNGRCNNSATIDVFVNHNETEILVDLAQLCSNDTTTLTADTIYFS